MRKRRERERESEREREYKNRFISQNAILIVTVGYLWRVAVV